MILIRADGNRYIGMGHIMRCLSIADAFRAVRQTVMFVLADDTVKQLVIDRGYNPIVLNSRFDDIDSEISIWDSMSIPDADITIVDSYYITDNYLRVLMERDGRGKLVYIDDMARFPYPVDIIVNYNAYANQSIYEKLYKKNRGNLPILVLGQSYAPLRTMFQGIPNKIQRRTVKRVLFSTGGSDERHISLEMIKYLCGMADKIGGFYFHFLLGAMNPDIEIIKDLIVKYSINDRVYIHENVSNMRSLISDMDIVVSAAGSTIYEIAACGVPLITFSTADNQLKGAETFDSLGMAINFGELCKQGDVMSNYDIRESVDRLFFTINKLSLDYEKRVKMGEKMQEMIDGRGADRIVKTLLTCNKTEMYQ